MKKHTKLSIKNPCSKEFDKFRPTSKGGFCSSCQTEVVDFTKMTDDEVISYFKNRTQKVCGRFQPSQLTTYSDKGSLYKKYNFRKVGIGLLGLSLFSISSVRAVANSIHSSEIPQSTEVRFRQNISLDTIVNKIKVSGLILYEDKEPLHGVNVILKATTTGVVSDVDGKFTIEVPADKPSTLIFSFVGFDTQEIEIEPIKTENLEIQLKPINMKAYQCLVVGEVSVNHIHQTKYTMWQKIKNWFRK